MLVLKLLLILSTIHTLTIFTYDIHNVSYDCHAIRGSLGRDGKRWKILKPSSQKAVAVVFERLPTIRL